MKNNGVASLSKMSAAGASVRTPTVIGAMKPVLMEYVLNATAKLLTVVVVTSLMTPIIVKRYKENNL
ncbi:hypothetical protein FEZ33_02970 [Ruoffia tabacinasalis]|uniref:Uncharacterized protein n=1 Tax=Ruoffia tabacinasalis TaxID=87458 RepID=A0A5R9EJ94_9LACT|nr:hypothetical protein FEZ33_02970 [Ruoffia tabacinasalis]HBY89918.1 hypothetical protein [Aerococcaceae bacterium]